MAYGEHAGVAGAEDQPHEGREDQRAAHDADARAPLVDRRDHQRADDDGEHEQVEHPADGRGVAALLLGRRGAARGRLGFGRGHRAPDGPLGDLDDVGQQHRAGHRADALGVGRDPAGDVPDVGSTSPVTLPSTRETPTSRTAAPGLTMSPVMMPGHAGRGDDDVGVAHVGGQVAGAGVAQRHRGVLASGGSAAGRAGRPTVRPRPTTTTSAPAISTPWRRSSSIAADGRAGQRAGLAEHQLAEVGRVQAVDVLVGVDAREQRELVEAGRLLHEEAGARGVGVELVDHGLDLGLRGGRRAGRGGSRRCRSRRSPCAWRRRTSASRGRRRPAPCRGRARRPAP